MATVNNPYSDLLSIMASQGAINNPPGLKLGTIKSIKPFIIYVDGLELNEDFVKVSESLKPHKRKCKLDGKFNIKLDTAYTPKLSNASCECGTHSHTSSSLSSVIGEIGTFEGELEYTDWLIKENDTVVVLCSNDLQKYVVIAKI